MPNPGSDRPLRKVTLNLYEEDCAALEISHGRGWSEVVRQHVHDMVSRKPAATLNKEQMKERVEFHRRRFLGDLSDD